ncbi:extracellular catalytic domain type 1 short-chain-length polyhydroxyalkanoate depolymerase [Azospirillum soli]|uniref:extracellular catalytic domain type 1 short-chain-length polyhydroxyalkanoate depolymerase n=1 Tax=Azospirillum soli TaxID=1304799 RepID=UPI001FE5A4E4|nr:PHB depolymerase family esterase [Azospirillum soli]MBP2312436.1 poly(hydroxyalkanoate) depolymerase family esterase [Azospirillum soli]
MAEATRLTRAGRLAEATALIQRLLRGERPSPTQDAASATVIDGEAVTVDVSDPPRATENPKPGPQGSNLRDLFRNLVARVAPAARDQRTARPASPGAGRFVSATFSNEAGARDYKLYIPANHGADQGRRPLPLVVMLHGCTQSPDDFAAGTRMNDLAEEIGCFVAYPAQPPKANAQKCWNWFSPEHQQPGQGEPSLIAGITRRIMREHPVDPARVYIAGLSAGGAAAAIMAATYPDLYTAVGVHSGLACGAARDLPSAFAAMRNGASPTALNTPTRVVPTIVFHGDKDKTVHPRNADSVLSQSKAGAPLQTTEQRGQVPDGHAYTRAVHADASGRTLFEQWTIHGAGHAWAGGSPDGSYTDPRGPDAAREMLRFFLEHRHPAPAR